MKKLINLDCILKQYLIPEAGKRFNSYWIERNWIILKVVNADKNCGAEKKE